MNTREKIIIALEKSKGDYISGEELALKLGVSRNAVWKAIKTLREQGYNIEAVTNKGYKLSTESDIISREGIALHLNDKALSECIEVYDELNSTNDLAKKYLFVDVPREVTEAKKRCHIIIAREQTGGRGHKKKAFDSPKGGIYMSIVLPAEMFENKEQKNISKLARQSVSKSVNELMGHKLEKGDDHGLYLGREKVCGLLTEILSDYEDGTISDYIIGIGIRYEMLRQEEKDLKISKNKLIADILNRIVA